MLRDAAAVPSFMADESSAPEQYWVKTESGKVLGPLTLASLELFAAHADRHVGVGRRAVAAATFVA